MYILIMGKLTVFTLLCLIPVILSVPAVENEEFPRFLTKEEIARARDNPFRPDNSTVLPLPPFGEGAVYPQPKPGFGPRLWTNAIVPYTLDPTFSQAQRDAVAQALNVFHEYTCVRFVPKENQGSWVDIEHDPGTCGVAVVCMNNGGQFARFGGSCVNPGTMVHELGHTLCMGHEQTRQDRDKWIGFNTAICEPHGIDGNDFNRGLNKLYDYVSIEHYEGECYNGCFVPKQPGVTKCGSGGPLSVLDIEIINEMYGCNSGCLGYRFVSSSGPVNDLVEVGAEFNGDILYTCRAYHQGDIIVGKYHSGTKECHVAYNGEEHRKTTDVEVLTNPNRAPLQWTNFPTLPANTIRGGRTNERETIYIVRCRLGLVGGAETWIPGKYQQGLGAYTSYGGREVACTGTFQFLTCSG